MRILMVSMFSNHFFNWTEQLKDSGHEIYWLDVFDSNTKVEKLDFVTQITGWRFKVDYPGRHLLKKKYRRFYNFTNNFNERDFVTFFEKTLEEVQPDVVQSFVLQSAGYPIVSVMKKHPDIKWVFSAWGNDLYYRQQTGEEDLRKIKKTLPAFDFMFADCLRDFEVAKKLGFKGSFLGAFPGGGGYEYKNYEAQYFPLNTRKAILIKGYQSHLGRCNIILQAIMNQKDLLRNYEIIIFGGNDYVRKFLVQHEMISWENLVFLEKIPQRKVIELMGKSMIYIGNSISDGMPNTLLEAILMGAFPIQSNPGGATAEIIQDKVNGLLINDPENSVEIEKLLKLAVVNISMRENGVTYNIEKIRPLLERDYVRSNVLKKYNIIEESLNPRNVSHK